MKLKILFGLVVFALCASRASAQTSSSWTMDCLPNPALVQVIQAAAVRTLISEGSCTGTGNINGVAVKSIQSSSYQEQSATQYRAWGLIIQTFANGDQITYTYQATAAAKNGVELTGIRTYQVTGGSGNFKGITGTGTCNIAYLPTGGSTSVCNGTFKLP